MTVCKSNDKWIHFPDSKNPSKILCNKETIDIHTCGSIGRKYKIKDVCLICWKKLKERKEEN